MNSDREVVVLSGVRTAIGDYGGALKDVAPTEIAAQVVREAVKRARIEGDVTYGSLTIEQGVDMGRPSQIRLQVAKIGGVVQQVVVGGDCVPVMRGELIVETD